MEYMEYIPKIRKIVNDFGLEISLTQAKKFVFYMDILLKWNKKINLTAITEPDQILIKHFMDSLSILKYLRLEKNQRVIDVGSGAGFPGMPLKILYPENNFMFVDSLNKRVEFLKYLQEQLDLKHVDVLHGRAEELAKQERYREKYNLCVSRAVANLRILTELCFPLVTYGGFFVAYKNFGIQEEISEAQNAIKKLGGRIVDVKEVVLSKDIKHVLIFIRKFFFTPPKYPRVFAQISKKPL